jgi:hypothetical protein
MNEEELRITVLNGRALRTAREGISGLSAIFDTFNHVIPPTNRVD